MVTADGARRLIFLTRQSFARAYRGLLWKMRRSTVRRWIDRHPEFDKAYTRARELLGDFHFEAMIKIADDASGDKTLDAKGNPQVSWENVQRSKLRIETRRWVVARLNPAKCSEKIVQQHTGANDGPIEIARKEPLTTAEVAAELSKLIGVAEKEMGLPPGGSQPVEERIARIKEAGNGVLPPAIYAALWQHERGNAATVH